MNIYLDWSEFKTRVSVKARVRFVEKPEFYTIFYSDDAGTFETSIMKDSGSDQTDFETNYKSLANKKLNAIDSDGRVITRPIAAQSGWTAQFHTLRISTSTTSGVYSKKRDGTDTGFCTYVMKDVNGATTATPADCVETQVTWEPNYDTERVSGKLYQKEPPAQDVYLWVVGAPDVPAQYGGNVAFTEGGINLADVGIGGTADFDGRASKFIAYDPTYHSGKFLIVCKHSAGFAHSFTIMFEIFKP